METLDEMLAKLSVREREEMTLEVAGILRDTKEYNQRSGKPSVPSETKNAADPPAPGKVRKSRSRPRNVTD